ncbi:MAG: SH3 domain-containing protein [Candidatus Cloacimonetes bacterium]|jgi:tetratricopeptide (TPR) repeat protein|nr:SH3 domain-containing protein [Candidatus Cloacimonadota bacterium]MDD2506089.1 SH3 domain-containing protein [Candidatus Cloacimonadota bacterium]MDD4147694.1 SH3 domain-containing protein [Candidatus Cloacimonadota bacterium]MDD4559672.1 SH3 domain-containing protein [Candidatus Cloacimonadota bacterium]
MKRLCIALILVGLVSLSAANEFDRMKELESKGIQNPDLYYNLGVSYWQTGQSGMATLYFLKALHLNSAHKAAQENLNYTINLSQDHELYPQRPFLLRVALQTYDFMNLNRMAILCLVLLILCALGFVWYVNYDPEREKGLPSLVLGILLVLMLLSVGFTGFKAYRRAHNVQAVLIESRADLRTEARSDSPRVAQIHEGIILKLKQSEGEWTFVILPNGQTGWIEEKAIARVK